MNNSIIDIQIENWFFKPSSQFFRMTAVDFAVDYGVMIASLDRLAVYSVIGSANLVGRNAIY